MLEANLKTNRNLQKKIGVAAIISRYDLYCFTQIDSKDARADRYYVVAISTGTVIHHAALGEES
jgi:hypothetical protein